MKMKKESFYLRTLLSRKKETIKKCEDDNYFFLTQKLRKKRSKNPTKRQKDMGWRGGTTFFSLYHVQSNVPKNKYCAYIQTLQYICNYYIGHKSHYVPWFGSRRIPGILSSRKKLSYPRGQCPLLSYVWRISLWSSLNIHMCEELYLLLFIFCHI